MDSFGKKEKGLRDIIENQKEQLGRYEKKLRDVIQAYKSIIKEKEALEASLAALNDTDTQKKSVKEEKTVSDGSGADENSEEPSEANSLQDSADEISSLKSKISTLSASLSTISAEKSRIESSFQKDRKRLLQDKEDLEKSLALACDQAESTNQSLKHQLSELKAHLSLEKNERSQEASNSQVIMRELQKTIVEERKAKETCEAELNSKSGRLNQLSANTNQLEQAERKVRDISNELEASKVKLRIAEDKLSRPSPHLIQLQNEMADMKVQHRLAIQLEQRNSSEIKEAAQKLDASHEKRVSTLEARLAELSLTVGSYDRLRQEDLSTVSKLKEQIFVLQRERNGASNVQEVEEDGECSADKLIDKIVSLKAKLDQVSKRQGDVKIKALLESRGLGHSSDYELCQKELMHAKQEMERLKQEQCTKSRSEMHPKMTDDEINALRVQAIFLKNELQHCQDECDRLLADARQSAAKEQSSIKEELAQSKRSHRARIAELEHQFQKQRDRSLALLQEKDEELANMRHLLLQAEDAPPPTAGVDGSKDPWPESITPLASMTLGASASGGQILHYVEELARKTVEIQGLRRSKYQLESSLRELQMSTVVLEQKTADQKSQLHDEIARLERNQSREGANLEYLKNVILEFFVCSDSSSQSHMFNAIATILQFSPGEMQRIQVEQTIW